MRKNLNLTLKIWRQKNRNTKGKFEIYQVSDISTGASFLEMLDILNEQLIRENRDPRGFRPRLPGRNLWNVLALHQWKSARTRYRNNNLPASHENV